jgi:hypothetical protein
MCSWRGMLPGHGLSPMTTLLAPSLAFATNLLLRQIKADSGIA